MTSRMKRTSQPDHEKFVREHLLLLEIILYDFKLILAKIQAQLTLREFMQQSERGDMRSLLELLMKKGETACRAFVSLLRDDAEVKETFRRLEGLDLGPKNPPEIAAPTQAGAQRPPQPAMGGQTRASKSKTFALEGKVMTVSKLMKKKVQFFRTNIKTNKKIWEVLVFKTELREQFVTAKSPVVLQRLQHGLQGSTLFKDSSKFKTTTAEVTGTTSPPGGPPPAP